MTNTAFYNRRSRYRFKFTSLKCVFLSDSPVGPFVGSDDHIVRVV